MSLLFRFFAIFPIIVGEKLKIKFSMVIEAYKYLENIDNTNHQRSSSPNCVSVDSRKRQTSYAGRSESPKKQRINISTKSVSESPNNGKNDGNDVMVIQADSSSTTER